MRDPGLPGKKLYGQSKACAIYAGKSKRLTFRSKSHVFSAYAYSCDILHFQIWDQSDKKWSHCLLDLHDKEALELIDRKHYSVQATLDSFCDQFYKYYTENPGETLKQILNEPRRRLTLLQRRKIISEEQFAEAAGQLCAALDGENLAIQKRLKDRAMREVRRHKREAQREHQEAQAAKKRKQGKKVYYR